jgi:hypothetical protein
LFLVAGAGGAAMSCDPRMGSDPKRGFRAQLMGTALHAARLWYKI